MELPIGLGQWSMQEIVFAGGCFWCTEAVFEEVRGVTNTEVGYANGHVPRPDYEAVCSGSTGHAEVVRVAWDERQLGLKELLEVFFLVHDPTTLNRQGHDVGTQYRSGIYWVNAAHESEVVAFVQSLRDENMYGGRPVVTELAPLSHYWPAEGYHQHYFRHYPERAYCQAVVAPKIAKFRSTYQKLTRA